MFQRFTLPLAASALVLGTFALAQSQPTIPESIATNTTGIVVGAPRMMAKTIEFDLRTNTGLFRVRPHSKKQMEKIFGGDLVRVYGQRQGKIIYGANVKLLGAKASDNPEDYDNPDVQKLDGEPREGSLDN